MPKRKPRPQGTDQLAQSNYEKGLSLLDSGKPRRGFLAVRKAALAGLHDAQNVLGLLFEEGRGTGRSLARARNWFGRAIQQGDNLALANLGLLEAAAGDQGLARVLLLRSVRRDNVEGLLDLAKISLARGEHSRAVRELRRLLNSKEPIIESVREDAEAMLAKLS